MCERVCLHGSKTPSPCSAGLSFAVLSRPTTESRTSLRLLLTSAWAERRSGLWHTGENCPRGAHTHRHSRANRRPPRDISPATPPSPAPCPLHPSCLRSFRKVQNPGKREHIFSVPCDESSPKMRSLLWKVREGRRGREGGEEGFEWRWSVLTGDRCVSAVEPAPEHLWGDDGQGHAGGRRSSRQRACTHNRHARGLRGTIGAASPALLQQKAASRSCEPAAYLSRRLAEPVMRVGCASTRTVMRSHMRAHT